MKTLQVYNDLWAHYVKQNKMRLLLDIGGELTKFLSDSKIINVDAHFLDSGYHYMQIYNITVVSGQKEIVIVKGNDVFRSHQRAAQWGFKSIHKLVRSLKESETKSLKEFLEKMNFEEMYYRHMCESKGVRLIKVNELSSLAGEGGDTLVLSSYYAEDEIELLALCEKNGISSPKIIEDTYTIYDDEFYRMKYQFIVLR